MSPQRPQFIIEFTERPDGGPLLVGTFPDKARAQEYVDDLRLLHPVYEVMELAHP